MVLKGLIISDMKKTKTDDSKPDVSKSKVSFAYRIAVLWGIMLTIGVVILVFMRLAKVHGAFGINFLHHWSKGPGFACEVRVSGE